MAEPSRPAPEFGVFHHWNSVPETHRGLSVALGNFDGLHRGHMAVVDAARTAAQHGGWGWALATFEPPPRVFFGRADIPFRLSSPEVRAELAAAAGASAVFELPFDAQLAQMDDETFIDAVIACGLGAKHVAVGADFRFGRGRVGDVRSLTRLCAGHGISTSVVSPVPEDEGAAEKISSSAIREALRAGKPLAAAQRLGRWWTVRGVVEHGEKRGRTIGYPTANLRLGDMTEPRHGIYTVLARVDGGDWRAGVANFGRTPTTGLRDPLLEVHVFDFDEDIYGRPMDVAFLSFIRPEARFNTVDDLVKQMHKDAESAKNGLNHLGWGGAVRTLPAVPNG